MKTNVLTKLSALFICILIMCCLCACEKDTNVEQTDIATVDETKALDPLWEGALYLEDTVLGDGETSIDIVIEAGEKAVTLTLNTNENNLQDALIGEKLIEGEQGAYGLYIKKVNCILADYDVDQSYWAIYKDDEYLTTGASETLIESGDYYKLVYTK